MKNKNKPRNQKSMQISCIQYTSTNPAPEKKQHPISEKVLIWRTSPLNTPYCFTWSLPKGAAWPVGLWNAMMKWYAPHQEGCHLCQLTGLQRYSNEWLIGSFGCRCFGFQNDPLMKGMVTVGHPGSKPTGIQTTNLPQYKYKFLFGGFNF